MSMEELYQDEVWTQRGGVTLRLKDMAPSHRRNLLAWVERNGAKLRRAEMNSLWQFLMFLNGEMAQDSVESEIHVLESMSVDQYVDGLPIVVKLRKMVAKDIRRPLADRMEREAKGKAATEAAKRAAVLDDFDAPDDAPTVPPVEVRTPLPRRGGGDLVVPSVVRSHAVAARAAGIRERLRPHPASQDGMRVSDFIPDPHPAYPYDRIH